MCVCSGVHVSEVNPSYCSRKTWDRKSRNKVGSCSCKPITPRTHLLPLWCHGGIYTPSTTPMIAIWDIFYFYNYCPWAVLKLWNSWSARSFFCQSIWIFHKDSITDEFKHYKFCKRKKPQQQPKKSKNKNKQELREPKGSDSIKTMMFLLQYNGFSLLWYHCDVIGCQIGK